VFSTPEYFCSVGVKETNMRLVDEVIHDLGTTSDKIRALGREGYSASEISRALDIRYQFAYGVLARAGLIGSVRNEPDVESEVVDEALEQTFTLERDLQQAIRHHIEQLEVGLRVADDGTERTVASGRIDITAKDAKEATVAIELKAGTADHKAIGQLLSYMGDLMAEGVKEVRGVLVAAQFTDRAISAAKAAPNIALRMYSFQFAFQPVE
jgi:hypothetical protein